MTWYLILLAAVGVERLAEMVLAQRNLAWSRARGGVEVGAAHYPVMVALHLALLVGCVVEVAVMHRPFIPALGWPMLALVIAAQGLRWWCITTLGRQWNTRVVVIPGAARSLLGRRNQDAAFVGDRAVDVQGQKPVANAYVLMLRVHA